jgi:hypothetical protein
MVKVEEVRQYATRKHSIGQLSWGPAPKGRRVSMACGYSYLSAVMGSTRVARLAGRSAAIKPTAINIPPATLSG